MFVGLTFLIVTGSLMLHARIIDEDMYLYWRLSDASKCEPFTTYMVSCNKCICSAEGIPYCTRMACHDEVPTNKINQINPTLPREEEEESSIEND